MKWPKPPAAQRAISSPLLEETSIQGARGVLINISGGHDLTLHEVAEAARIISDAVDPDANIISGMVIEPGLEDAMKVTVIATGFDRGGVERPRAPGAAACREELAAALEETSASETLRTGRERGGGAAPPQLVHVTEERRVVPQGRQILEQQRQGAALPQHGRREVLDDAVPVHQPR